ncbi:MAG: ribbon-helix-helix protein, CopG family [Nitrososphaerales archaeon]|nr:ribbon-helix-helix protein, CopG family [Nitrososphaerales archaeon]
MYSTGAEKSTTPKISVAMTEEMLKALEEERKVRKIATIPEVVRIIVSDYYKTKSGN